MNLNRFTGVRIPLYIVIITVLAIFILPLLFSDEAISKVKQAQDLDSNGWHWYVYYLYSLSISFVYTCVCTGLTFSFSLILSILIRLKMGKYSPFFESVFSGMRALPSVAWIPLLCIFKLYADAPGLIVMVSLGIFPTIITQIIHGINNCPREKTDVAKLVNANNFQLFFFVIIPSCISDMVLALRYGATLSFILVLVYEIFFGFPKGVISVTPILEPGYPIGDAIILLLALGCTGVLLDHIPNIIKSINIYFARRIL